MSVFNNRKPIFYILILIIIITVALGLILVSNLNNLNMEEKFLPKSIEIEIDGEMKNIDFSEEATNNIAYHLKYETWEKAEMNYDLSTMTYLADENNKVVGLYEDVDGFTYFVLYSGFGLRNGNFYKAPLDVYENIEKYIINYYNKNFYVDDVDSTVDEEQIEKNNPEITENNSFNLNQIDDIANLYGYNNSVILESNLKEVELLIYYPEIITNADLLAKRLKLNSNNEVVSEIDIYLPEELIGYRIDFKIRDSSSKKYLLAYRYNINNSDKKIYSDLLAFTKEDLTMIILQSYDLDYDEEKGIIPQGVIPTIIDFSVDIIDDYVLYEDLDLYYKVQDIRTKEIYNSGENNPILKEVQPYYAVSGEYIYLAKYSIDDSILAFNTNSKEFEKLR